MNIEDRAVVRHVGSPQSPGLCALLLLSNRIAKCRAHPGRLPELRGQLHQQIFLRIDRTARVGNLLGDQLWKREMLEHGHAIGESFVKSLDVRVTGEQEAAVQAIEQRVSRFVARCRATDGFFPLAVMPDRRRR